MVDKKKLTEFIIKARTKTYAGNSGKVKPLLEGSYQLEYSEGTWLYRDIYNLGNGKFAGLETVYFESKPVWSMSYYGNFERMTEEEVDKTLRKALIDQADKVRLWNDVEYKTEDYVYSNSGSGNIDESEGSEKIEKDGETLYYLYYAAGFIG